MKKWHLAFLLSTVSMQLLYSEECNDNLLPGHDALNCDYGMRLCGSALYWRATEEGLDYAIESESGVAFINDDGNVKRMGFDWDWGFRVGLGYQVPNNKMDFSLLWTRYETSHSRSSSVVFPASLFSVWTYPGANLSSESNAKSKSHLKLNVIDLVMGATFSPRPFLDLKPFIGLSNAWIDQKFDIDLSGGSNTQIVNAIVLNDHIFLKNDFWGIGPKMGINTTWILGWGISIFGNADVTLFYGLFDVKQKEEVLLAGITPEFTYLDINHNKFHLLRANFDAILGLRWDRLFYENRYRLCIEAGWETTIYWGQNQLMRFVTSGQPGINVSGKGDLCLQGLTLKAGFAF